MLLYDCYCRAAWIDPDDAQHLLLGPAEGVEQNGRIEETWDGGMAWHNVSIGLGTPWPQHMVERFCQIDTALWATIGL